MQTPYEHDWVTMPSGFQRRILSVGRELMNMLARFEAGQVAPEHSHPHEQVSVVIEGRGNFTVAGVSFDVQAGDSILIPGGIPHSFVAHSAALLLDTFHPPREDLITR